MLAYLQKSILPLLTQSDNEGEDNNKQAVMANSLLHRDVPNLLLAIAKQYKSEANVSFSKAIEATAKVADPEEF